MNKPAESFNTQKPVWINPIGGLGDMLMLSGVIKLAADRDKSRCFNMVRRSAYRSIFQHHPAIKEIGYPPPGANVMGTDYWTHGIVANENRPYQILARLFGLPTPVEEILFFPGPIEIDAVLEQAIPWGKKNVIMATGSDSPRKTMAFERWGQLAKQLKDDGFFVMQAGRLQEPHITNTYSLLGLTNPGQLIALIKRVDIVITIDTLVMHAAHLAGVPAVVLWGPNDNETFGFSGQCHLRH